MASEIDKKVKKILNSDKCEDRKRINNEQKKLLVEFVNLHPELKAGKFTATFTAKKGRELWQEISNILNSVPCAAIKSADQWKRTWQDMKKHTKMKISRIKKHRRVTGGGPKTKEELTDTQSRVYDLLGETAVHGHEGVPESKAYFDFNINQMDDCAEYIVDNDDITESEDDNIIEVSIDKENTDSVRSDGGKAEDTAEETPKPSKEKNPRLFTTKRLENTVEASKKLAEIGEIRNTMTSCYYEKKISLMERNVISNEKGVEILQEISNNLNIIANTLLSDTFNVNN